MNRNRSLILFSGILAFFFSGMLYGWSILKVPLSDEVGFSITDLSVNFALTMCTFCVGGICSGFLQRRISARIILFISGLLAMTGFFITGSLHQGQVLYLLLGYGIFNGFAIGLQYNTILSVANAWFPDKKGLCSGVLLMSFGCSALVCGITADFLIRSSFGWRNTYYLMGVLILLTSVFSGIVTVYPPQVEDPGTISSKTDIEPRKMIKKPSFWKLFFFLIFAACVGNSTISFARDIAISVGASAAAASFLAGILSLCNGIGRLLAGIIYDKKGRRYTMTLDGIVTIAAPAMMLAAVLSRNLWLCIAGLCITGISYGFQPPITSSVTASFYGTRYYSINYSIVNLMLIPTSVIASINGYLYSRTLTYAAPLALLLLLSIISFLINLSIREA